MKQFAILLIIGLFISCVPKNNTPRTENILPSPAPGPSPTPEKWLQPQDISDARALLEEWLAAQNEGLFEKYASLYGKEFFGIKRAGNETTQYNRDTWLADRKKMFRKDMIVETYGISFKAKGDHLAMEFNQTWESAAYKDTGKKELVLARSEGKFLIIREEMMDSRILKTLAPEARKDYEFYFVLANRYLVIAPILLEGDRSEELVLEAGGYDALVSLTPEESEIPEKYKTFRKRKFAFYTDSGLSAEGTVEKLQVIGHVIPHFGTVQTWEGAYDESPWSEEMIAQEIWSLAQNDGTYLVGVLEEALPSSTIWAIPADQQEPQWFFTANPADFSEEKLREALLSTESYQRLHQEITEYRESFGVDPETDISWIEEEDINNYTFDNNSGQRYHGMYVDFFATGIIINQGYIWKETTAGALELFLDIDTYGPAAATPDLNGNGIPDFITNSGFGETQFLLDGNVFQSLSIPYYDCPF